MMHTRVPLPAATASRLHEGKGLKSPETLSREKRLPSVHIGHRAKEGLSPFLVSVFDPESPCPSPSVSEAWTPFNLEVPDHCLGCSAAWLLGTEKAAR